VGIDTSVQPRKLVIPGDPPITLWDVRKRYEVTCHYQRSLNRITDIAVHHDGVLFEKGDRDYDGSTVDEDLARMDADARAAARFGWPDMPYHAIISPNGKAYYVRSTDLVGANVNRGNTPVIGVALMGDFSLRDPDIIAQQLAGVFIGAAFRGLWRPLRIRPHHDFDGQSTVCPGYHTDRWLPRIKRVAHSSSGL
jgi:hypothetical protein